jgi:hypothetical protein
MDGRDKKIAVLERKILSLVSMASADDLSFGAIKVK